MFEYKPIGKPRSPSGAGWVVVKFGGTSVATRARWERIAGIVHRHRRAGHRVLVVCSALAGVTNRLEALVAARDAAADPGDHVAAIARAHAALAADLGVDGGALVAAEQAALAVAATTRGAVTPRERAAIGALGELMSTRLGAAYLARRGLDAAWADARALLRAEPGGARAERYLSARCAPAPSPEARAHLDALGAPVVVTQGFIARDDAGDTVVLGRGGSDASAAYLAAAIGAVALEIWTDVPGLFTADPRACAGARLLRRVSYGEAEAIAALGAKVLHPRTIEPCRVRGIPIRIGWTARPEVAGTRIAGTRPPGGVKAITSRRALALISMWRPSSWQPVGFLAEVAARFQRRGLSIDLLATSPSEIRATVDLAAFPTAEAELPALLADLGEVCRARATTRVGCVSVVGSGAAALIARGPGALAGGLDTPAHLVSHAANGTHVSVVLDEDVLDAALAGLHAALLDGADDESVFGAPWSELSAPAPRAAAAANANAGANANVTPGRAPAGDAAEEAPCARAQA